MLVFHYPKRLQRIVGNCARLRRSIMLLALLLMLFPTTLHAQSHTLLVTLRDGSGAAVPQITVRVRSLKGAVLVEGVTDGEGQVAFADLPTQVRVAVQGQPRGGPALYQIGADAEGVLLRLDTGDHPVRLDLRVERDGMVLPDPGTMIDLIVGGPEVDTVLIPTVPVVEPTAPPTQPMHGSVAIATSTPAQDTTPPWLLPLVLLVAVVLGGTVLLLRSLGRSR